MTVYGDIAESLRKAITDGAYPPGSTLPSLRDLMAEHGVAQETARAAIQQLTNEGLVYPQRGRGTIVRDLSPVALASTPSAPAQPWHVQVDGGRDEVVLAEFEPADVGTAQRLGITAGSPVLHRVRHFYNGATIATIADQWIREDVVNAIRDSGNGDLADLAQRPDVERDLYMLMAAAGHAPRRRTEHVGTRMPDPDEREVLQLPPGVPVLLTVRFTFGSDEAPVETATFVGAGDRASIAFTTELSY